MKTKMSPAAKDRKFRFRFTLIELLDGHAESMKNSKIGCNLYVTGGRNSTQPDGAL